MMGAGMRKIVAERELLYSLKGEPTRRKFVVRISMPCQIEENAVNFPVHPGAAVCEIEFDGLPEDFTEEVYGADSIQALSLATDVDPYLRSLEKKYDLYWSTGEPYFEE
jgi:hypothetical protein